MRSGERYVTFVFPGDAGKLLSRERVAFQGRVLRVVQAAAKPAPPARFTAFLRVRTIRANFFLN